MPDEKSLGSKLLGLFVEPKEGEPGDTAKKSDEEKSPAELVEELARSSAPKAQGPAPAGGTAPAPAAAPPRAPAPVPVTAGAGVVAAKVDFDVVFKSAGVDPTELDRVRKAEELLKSLPEGTPVEVRRQIVEASLKAFGVELSRIAGAAQLQLKALETYVKVNEQQTAKAIADMKASIAQLEDKVISLKADISTKSEGLAALAAAAAARRQQVERVLEFFATTPAPQQKP